MNFTFTSLLLGLLNIAVVVVFLLIVGVVVKWVFDKWITPLPDQLRQLYIALVALIALYMFLALLFGMPTWHPLVSIRG